MDENKISDAYCLIVVRYLFNFCLKLKDDFLSKFQEGVEIFNAMPPSLLGLYGCNWANNDILTWFERFYLVKFFICFPGDGDVHFNVHKPSGGSEFDYIDRNHDFDDKVGPTENNALDLNNEYFKLKDGELAAIGFIIIVFDGSHYNCLLRPSGSSCPFFQVGKKLPEQLYKGCQITSEFWESLSISSSTNHNKKILQNINDFTKPLNNDFTKPLIGKNFCPVEFRKIHKNLKAFKYKYEDLEKIIFRKFTNEKRKLTQAMTSAKMASQKNTKKLYSKFDKSIIHEKYTIKPIYLAGRIFESLFPEDHAFSNIVGNYNISIHSLHGKHNKSVNFLQSLSFDLQYLFPKKHLDFIDILNNINEQKKEEEKNY